MMNTLRCKMLLQRTFVSDKSREIQKVWHPFSNSRNIILMRRIKACELVAFFLFLCNLICSEVRSTGPVFKGGPGSCRKLREAEIT